MGAWILYTEYYTVILIPSKYGDTHTGYSYRVYEDTHTESLILIPVLFSILILVIFIPICGGNKYPILIPAWHTHTDTHTRHWISIPSVLTLKTFIKVHQPQSLYTHYIRIHRKQEDLFFFKKELLPEEKKQEKN